MDFDRKEEFQNFNKMNKRNNQNKLILWSLNC